MLAVNMLINHLLVDVCHSFLPGCMVHTVVAEAGRSSVEVARQIQALLRAVLSKTDQTGLPAGRAFTSVVCRLIDLHEALQLRHQDFPTSSQGSLHMALLHVFWHSASLCFLTYVWQVPNDVGTE